MAKPCQFLIASGNAGSTIVDLGIQALNYLKKSDKNGFPESGYC
jgi:hypothetical protein